MGKIHLMRVVRGNSFSSRKTSMITLYKALIQSQLDYGAPVYASASKSQLARLDVIQGKALRIALGALPCTPLPALLREAGIKPLSVRREELTLQFYARASARGISNPFIQAVNECDSQPLRIKGSKTPLGTTVSNLTQEYYKETVDIADFSPHPYPPWLLSAPKVSIELSTKFTKSDLPSLIRSTALEMINSKHYLALQIYTDGSKCPDTQKTAAGLAIPSFKISKSFRLNNNLSIYTAELVAISKSLDWILDHEPLRSVVLSDSLSAVQSLKAQGSVTRPNLVSDIVFKFNQCTWKGLDTMIEWIPAHVDIRGNDMADRAAKEGLSRPIIDISVKLAPKECRSIIKRHGSRKWGEKWSVYAREKGLDHIFPGVQTRPPPQYDRTCLGDRAVTRLRLGYTMLPGSVGIYILGLDPECPACLVPDGNKHRLMECPRFGSAREKLFSLLTTLDVPHTLCGLLNPPRRVERAVHTGLVAFLVATDQIGEL